MPSADALQLERPRPTNSLQYTKSWTAREFTPLKGGLIMGQMEGIVTARPNYELDFPVSGLVAIESKKGCSYQLDLPDSMQIYPVLYADRL